MPIKVYRQRCARCLFGPRPVMTLGQAERIERQMDYSSSAFVCHRASDRGQTVYCRGDYDCRREYVLAIAGRFSGIEFIDQVPHDPKIDYDPKGNPIDVKIEFDIF